MKRFAAIALAAYIVGVYCSPLSPVRCRDGFIGAHSYVWSCSW